MFRVPRRALALVGALALTISLVGTTTATHSWGGYHWARTTSSFTLKLADNVSGPWDAVLATTSADWSQSAVLDTSIVAGTITNTKNCKAATGKVNVCNNTYGNNGWLGVAGISVSGGHITAAYVKLNDTYFNTGSYNSTAWRNLVSCQEVGHTFGLDHQDTNFDNANLGTCMDYTSDPSTNQHPNKHDYDELVTIYNHLDATTTVAAAPVVAGALVGRAVEAAWGTFVRSTDRGHGAWFVKDLGAGNLILTHVFWA